MFCTVCADTLLNEPCRLLYSQYFQSFELCDNFRMSPENEPCGQLQNSDGQWIGKLLGRLNDARILMNMQIKFRSMLINSNIII